MFPELLAFITVSVLYSCLQKLSRSRKNEIDVLKSVLVHSSKEFNEEVKVKPKQHLSTAKIQRLLTLGQLTSVGFLCIAGSVQPSLPNGVYFLSFVAFSTWLACNRKLSR